MFPTYMTGRCRKVRNEMASEEYLRSLEIGKDDMISRQAVLDILAKHRCGYYSFDDYEILDKLMKEVSNLPSKGGEKN